MFDVQLGRVEAISSTVSAKDGTIANPRVCLGVQYVFIVPRVRGLPTSAKWKLPPRIDAP